MTVMGSLSTLVKNQGMTVCTVIHQPRKQIYDMFDSLILLGVGGNMVYHGPVTSAKDYFFKLGYSIDEGESLADWMMDISSGELSPSSEDESKSMSTPVENSEGYIDESTEKIADNDEGGSVLEVPLLSAQHDTDLQSATPAENRER